MSEPIAKAGRHPRVPLVPLASEAAAAQRSQAKALPLSALETPAAQERKPALAATGLGRSSKRGPRPSGGPARPDARAKLLDAALTVIRQKGYAATSVDDLCRAAGVTKGAFFHHFKSKTDLAVAAAELWSDATGALFATAPYHDHSDPLDRVLGYVDFRKALLTGGVPEFTCLIGTMVQETYATEPAIRDACNASISGHAMKIEADIQAAMDLHGVKGTWTAASLAIHTQAVLQGAFILAKARSGAAVAADSIDHLHRYIELLFNRKADGAIAA